MFKHILIPTDGSEASLKAAHAGIELAKECGARVTGYSAIAGSTYRHVGAFITDEVRREIGHRMREAADIHIAKLAELARAAGVPFEGCVTEAPESFEGIVEAAVARGCDLICMGSRAQPGIAGLVQGSVTHDVLTHSKVPMLVYR